MTDTLMGFVSHVPLEQASAALAEETIPYVRKQKLALVWAVADGYTPLLSAPDWHTRWFALRGMMRKPGPPGQELWEASLRALEDTVPIVRRSGLGGMNRALEDSSLRAQAIDSVVARLNDRSPRVRGMAAWILRESVPETPTSVAREALKTERDRDTRFLLEAIAARSAE
jgi:hypothetical protein